RGSGNSSTGREKALVECARMEESFGSSGAKDRGKAPESRSSQILRIAIFVVIVAGLSALILVFAPHLSRARIHAWAKGAGVWGPLLLVGIQAGQIIAAPIPGVFVPVVAGILYGPVVGPLVTVVGTILGSTAAFWIGRTGGRRVTERLLGRDAVAK